MASLALESVPEDIEQPVQSPGNELELIRAELARLKLELSTTAAERDYLRNALSIKDDRFASFRRRSSSGNVALSTPNKALPVIKEFGESQAAAVQESRIGRPKRILIIGGGPAGLISLHETLSSANRPGGESLDQYEIALYERRAEVGGVWYFEPDNDLAKGLFGGLAQGDQRQLPIRKTSESAGDMESLDFTRVWGATGRAEEDDGYFSAATSNASPPNGQAAGRESASSLGSICLKVASVPRWPSPAYEGLVGNVLPPLLEFSAEPFPKLSGGLFPSAAETHQYLLNLAEPLRTHIKTKQEVIDVRPIYEEYNDLPRWSVTSVDWTGETKPLPTVSEWDAVIVAAGAFDHPYFPDVPGLGPLLAAKSPLIMHAKKYPGPRPFVNQRNRIVVVGNANSANDIAAHLAPLNDGPLYRCIRHASNFAHLSDSRIKDVAPVNAIHLSHDSRTLMLCLDDGTWLYGITKLIFASGYQYNFPWLHVPSPTSSCSPCPVPAPSTLRIAPASKHGAVPNLHASTFVSVAPTLAFIGLGAGSTPMPLAEIQARCVARAYHGLLKLQGETMKELLEDYHNRAAELELNDDDPRGWRDLHMIRGAEERRLTASLLAWLEEAEPGSSDGLFRWDDWREGVAKGMRAVKEGELRRLRQAKVAAGGVDGGVGGVLAMEAPVKGGREEVGAARFDRGMALAL